MNKRIPKVFVNNIKKINNNKMVFYSIKNNNEEITEKNTEIDITNKINNIFKLKDFVYKKKLHIKTTDYEKDFIIISKGIDYLLTMDGKRIYFSDIKEIY